MHFYEKHIRIKVVLLIEFFQIVVPKLRHDVLFGSYSFSCVINAFLWKTHQNKKDSKNTPGPNFNTQHSRYIELSHLKKKKILHAFLLHISQKYKYR